jgi:hypothetical protein
MLSLPFGSGSVTDEEDQRRWRSSANAGSAAGVVTEGFKLSIQPDQKHYELGDAVGLNVSFRNINRGAVEVYGRGK